MNKAKLLFFVSCPQCKKKFGCEPKFIEMYLRRIVEVYKDKYTSVSQMLQAAQVDVKSSRAKKEG